MFKLMFTEGEKVLVMWLPLTTAGTGKSVPYSHQIDFHQQWRLLNGDYINGEASLTAGPL